MLSASKCNTPINKYKYFDFGSKIYPLNHYFIGRNRRNTRLNGIHTRYEMRIDNFDGEIIKSSVGINMIGFSGMMPGNSIELIHGYNGVFELKEPVRILKNTKPNIGDLKCIAVYVN